MNQQQIDFMVAENSRLTLENENLQSKLFSICAIKPLIVGALKLLKTINFFKKKGWKNGIDTAITTLDFICP